MKTGMTELFGIKHPVMLAGMNWITEPKIVAAVSNAGGLGVMAIARCTPEEARQEIKKIRELTDKPFGINQNLMSPTAKGNINVAIDERVPVINYSLGRPGFIEQVHKYGGKVIGTVTQSRHALSAEKLGVDALNVTGHEAAGHSGRVTSMVLISVTAQKVKIPLIAAGGFYDGRGLVAALALGAQGINMGTRFAITKESPLHDHWKQLILKSSEDDTLYLDHLEMPRRVIKTKKAEAEGKGIILPIISSLAGALEAKRQLHLSFRQLIESGLKSRKGEEGIGTVEQIRFAANVAKARRLTIEGDVNIGAQSAGQNIGGIRDLPTCQELIDRIIAEAEEIMESLKTRYIS